MTDETFMRRPEVIKATGLATSTIYDHMAAGTFPKPVKLGAKSVAWLKSDIAAWQKRVIERGKAA